MARRVTTVTARIAFIVCGLTTLFTGFFYMQLHGVDLPVESEWIYFVAVLAVLGAFSLIAGVLPRSWIARACKIPRADDRLFSKPLKLLAIFAAIFYVIAAVGDFAPHTWNLNPQVMLVLCPLYFIKMTIDPSPVVVFAMLAPLNAAVYGSLGVFLGYAGLRFRK